MAGKGLDPVAVAKGDIVAAAIEHAEQGAKEGQRRGKQPFGIKQVVAMKSR